jgi:hypothetical protein
MSGPLIAFASWQWVFFGGPRQTSITLAVLVLTAILTAKVIDRVSHGQAHNRRWADWALLSVLVIGMLASVIGTLIYQRLNPVQPPPPTIPLEFPMVRGGDGG